MAGKTPPRSYAAAVEQAAALVAAACLKDPDGHFPYKHDTVIALLEENPPMGPGSPGGTDGGDDRSREAADYISVGIADATRDYVDAQAAYLLDNTKRDEYDAARDRLQAARMDHRAKRENTFTVGGAARRAG